MNRPRPTINQDNFYNEQLQESVAESQKMVQEASRSNANNALYSSYKSLDTLNDARKQLYGIIKLKKDTLINLDIKTKFKIKKEYYFQNTHDDSLRMAFKSPENLNIFIHDFQSKETSENDFKSLKRNADLQKYKMEKSTEKTTVFSYSITKKEQKFNGYALSFKVDGYQTFIEFESQNLSKEKLRFVTLDYLLLNLTQNK